jgi:hypothetical protein
MPNVKRKLRKFRQTDELTPERELYLQHGLEFWGLPFTDMEHARKVWRLQRAEILACWDPRRERRLRPWAHFEFDCEGPQQPMQHWEQVAFLEARGQLTPADVSYLESSPDFGTDGAAWAQTRIQGIALLSETLEAGQRHSPETDYSLQSRYVRLQRDVAEWHFLSGWHARRGRVEAAAAFEALAQLAGEKLEAATGPRAAWEAAREQVEVARCLRDLEADGKR